jgi:hypothetical protein
MVTMLFDIVILEVQMTSRSQYWTINNKMTVSDKEVETTTFLVLIVCEY